MFIPSKSNPAGRVISTGTLRSLIIGLYTLYPLGCVLQMLPESWGGSNWLTIIGLVLIVTALVIFAVLAGSSLQRQTQERENLLDERERSERNRASYQAHAVFSAIVLAGVMYMMISTDLALNDKLHVWRPTIGAHWNAIFGGLILLSFTLPGAILAFSRKGDPESD
jgi:H+/gluconate symporter-like permease